ncbi:MAG: leuA 6 [Firmicutes bacterium]|nr:leuA 6 [Bacillota bacterium]
MNDNFSPLSQPQPVYIVDTTLRDGEQAPGVVFTTKEKIAIAKLLDEIGVDQLEAGTPIMGGAEAEALKLIVKLGLRTSIMAWCRASINEVKVGLACGVDALEISAPTSDIHIVQKLKTSRQAVLENMVEAVSYAKAQGVYVSVGAEDTTRSDEAFVIEYALAAKKAGADRLRYCDTVGIIDPLALCERIRRLREKVPLPIEIHAHNDFGLATANALAAWQAGASFISTTVTGLGERSGNAALEEVIMALKHIFKQPVIYDTSKLKPTCNYVATAANRIISVSKPIIGEALFSHESGIHADAALKNPATYEPYPPEEVGLERHLIIGKHSGSAALRNRLGELGIELDKATASRLLPAVRDFAIKHKRALTGTDIIYLYEQLVPRP